MEKLIMRRHLWKFLFTLPLIFAVASTVALQNDCPALVQTALEELGQNCQSLERNNACYGYNKLAATFNEAQPDDFFTQVSDRTPLNVLDTLTTTPLDAEAGTWGVALMKVQANVPNSLPGQAVTFILLGDAEIRNDVSPADAFTPADPVDVTIIGNVNIRSGASALSNVVGSVGDGTVLPADGLSANGNWYRVLFNGAPAWVSAELVNAPEAAQQLPNIQGDVRTPMQAFYLTTGFSQTNCNDAPDALVVQGPDAVKVDLTVNGADITIGSTVVFRSLESSYGDLLNDLTLVELYGGLLTNQGVPGDLNCTVMQIMVVDGDAELNEDGLNLPTGFSAQSINCGGVDRSSNFVTPWVGSRPLSQEELNFLQTLNNIPPELLDYPIKVPTLEDIQGIIQAFGTGATDANDDTTDSAVGEVDCSTFTPTSPLGSMPGNVTQFYWDPAIGATNYVVRVYDASGNETSSGATSGPETSVTFNPAGASNLSWDVTAYYNGQVACTSGRVGVLRDILFDIPPPPPDTYTICVPYFQSCPAGCSQIGFCSGDNLCECPA
jgi:hypothetical protein